MSYDVPSPSFRGSCGGGRWANPPSEALIELSRSALQIHMACEIQRLHHHFLRASTLALQTLPSNPHLKTLPGVLLRCALLPFTV